VTRGIERGGSLRADVFAQETTEPKNNFWRGLDGFGKSCILANGSGVVEPAGHHSRVEAASSQRRIKRRPEVHPIVRFFTSTG
jgi:hypothetical protein